MQGSGVTIEISSPVENVVAEQRTAAKDTTHPQLPSRLITCSQTMLGDRELFPLLVRLQDLEHDTKRIAFCLEEAKNSYSADQPGPRRNGPGASSGRDTRLKKSLAPHRKQK